MPVEFFDVDHTIVSGSSGADFLVVGVSRGVFPPAALGYIPLVAIQLHLGLLRPGPRSWRLPILRGRARSTLEGLALESFRRLHRRVFPQARAVIRAARDRGGKVVLATSSVDLIVRPLADELGIEDVIASTLEFRGGICTGRFVDAPLLGKRKREKALEYLRLRGVDPRDCAFYSDSVYDLPLLEAVGRPVAVNPDRALSRRARSRGWPVLHWIRQSRRRPRAGDD
jgi:putative phosphoserine phosphatase/1-acylglycerol-3-phosphate O-acyltransferase